MRQTCVENTTFAEAYSKIREIATDLRAFLEGKHGIGLLTLEG
jgi:hypothetical protein